MKIQPVVQAYLWRCLIDLSFIHGGISTVFANFFWARRNQRTESIVTSKLCEVFFLPMSGISATTFVWKKENRRNTTMITCSCTGKPTTG